MWSADSARKRDALNSSTGKTSRVESFSKKNAQVKKDHPDEENEEKISVKYEAKGFKSNQGLNHDYL